MFLSAADDDEPRLAIRREGAYVTLSASYGPLEIAMRPRYEELMRAIARLTIVDGLMTTRQVGTSHAYLALGLHNDGSLLMRLTIVADATGHLSINLRLTDAVRQQLYQWLNVAAYNGRDVRDTQT
ncbi:MAG: hypothetical protein CUN49_14315 [Candidatus Thermofonsia Clade 1 bacterium]|uniref:Uncharacterized protein n=1 Tax=Candidatus Thermofonsia Clade 1 bacterium TaxID=2364210 RepID=A0A2M8PAY0_9CHLR|nr:MAG: hypothetical protein CUN49_14315 [Candidatus Thermofonsia Clade 1 bacterium]